MGILNRLNTLVRANVNELMRSSSEPDRALTRSITEMEDSVKDARTHVAQGRVAESRLLKEWRQARDEAFDWEDKAMEALRLGNESTARACLVRKQEHDARAEKLREDLEQQRGYLGDLENSMNALFHKLQSVRGRRDRVDRHLGTDRAEHRAARRARRDSGVTLPFDVDHDSPEEAFGAERPFQAFEAIGDRIEQGLANAEAASELSDDPLADHLSSRFEKLESERDLQQLRERSHQDDPPPVSDLRRKLLEELEG